MNAYTTIEESKQLTEAGLDVNTADMIYLCYKFSYNGNDYNEVGYHSVFKSEKGFYTSVNNELDLPCWSLAALLDILDKNSISYNLGNNISVIKHGIIVTIEDKYHLESYNVEKTIVKALLWALKNNYIKNDTNN